MDFKELTTKTVADLQKFLAEARAELHDARMKASGNQLKNVRQIREIRLRVAQLLTLIRAKR